MAAWARPVVDRPWVSAGVAAVALALVVWRVGPHADLPAFCYLALVGTALAVVDAATRRLPDALTLPSYVVALALLAIAAATGGGARFVHALLGMLALGALYGVQWLVAPRMLGFGDVKLAGLLGLYLGWLGPAAWVLGVLAGYVLAGLYGVGLLVARRAGRGDQIPYGPFMLAGTLVAVVAHP